MKGKDVMVLGAVGVIGYMLAPKEVKDQLTSGMPSVGVSIGDLLGGGQPSFPNIITESPFDLSELADQLTKIVSELPEPNLPEIPSPEIPSPNLDWLRDLLAGLPGKGNGDPKEKVIPTGWEWFTGLPEPLQAATGLAALGGGTYAAARLLPPTTGVAAKLIDATGKFIPKAGSKFIPKALVKAAPAAATKALPTLGVGGGLLGALAPLAAIFGVALGGMEVGKMVKPEWNWNVFSGSFWDVTKNVPATWRSLFSGDNVSLEMKQSAREAATGQPEAPSRPEHAFGSYPEVPSKPSAIYGPGEAKPEIIGTPYGPGYSVYIAGF